MRKPRARTGAKISFSKPGDGSLSSPVERTAQFSIFTPVRLRLLSLITRPKSIEALQSYQVPVLIIRLQD